NCKHVASRLKKATAFVGCLVINVFPLTTTASAKDSWFAVCNVSDNPLPIEKVFTTTFFLSAALFLILFYFVCAIEQTAFGAAVSRFLDRSTEHLHRSREPLLRAVSAVSFAMLLTDSGPILTQISQHFGDWRGFIRELNLNANWLPIIQLLIPVYQFSRATLPAAGAAILVLCGYGAVTCGPFHMLDYPVFIGLAVFFLLSVMQTTRAFAFRFDVLRWSVALSLLWPSTEIFVYPSRFAPFAAAHPELTMGLHVDAIVTAAGIVEFGLVFALFWTPLVRRLAALTLVVLLATAALEVGKVDGMGPVVIFAILLLVFVDPGREQPRCRPTLAPLAISGTWLATVFVYAGVHALNRGTQSAVLASFIGAAAALGFVFFCLMIRSPTATHLPREDEYEDWPSSRRSAESHWDVVPAHEHSRRAAADHRAGARAFSARART
ncbi:MAG: hypothetical protein J2P54_25235, partial [Bradyrhizobiaceae bacterium]|nr:hypothetical protein [Bradyrhizobiaceae bacterium]